MEAAALLLPRIHAGAAQAHHAASRNRSPRWFPRQLRSGETETLAVMRGVRLVRVARNTAKLHATFVSLKPSPAHGMSVLSRKNLSQMHGSMRQAPAPKMPHRKALQTHSPLFNCFALSNHSCILSSFGTPDKTHVSFETCSVWCRPEPAQSTPMCRDHRPTHCSISAVRSCRSFRFSAFNERSRCVDLRHFALPVNTRFSFLKQHTVLMLASAKTGRRKTFATSILPTMSAECRRLHFAACSSLTATT